MRPGLLLSASFATLFWSCGAQNQTALLDGFSHISACAQQCVVTSIPGSACQTFTNTTCICENEELKIMTELCIVDACNVTDALQVAGVQADACAYPVRNQRPSLLAPLAIELLAFPAVLTRLYSRWRYTPRYEIDDWIMVFCTPVFIVFEVVGHYTGQLGFGVDIWTVDPGTFTWALKLFYVDESFYLTVIILTKISMLFFYLRIFPQKKFRWACYGVMSWVTVSGVIFLFMQIFQCVPVPYIWEGWLDNFSSNQCLNVSALAYTAAAFSISQDIVILLMPMPLLWDLKASVRQRIDIGIMFSLGFFILLTSCIRLGFIVKFAKTSNPSWDYSGPLIWSGLECGVSMVVTSLPAIKTLFRRRISASSSTAPKRSDYYGSEGSSRFGRSKGTASKKSANWSMFSTKVGTQNESQIELDIKVRRQESPKPVTSSPSIPGEQPRESWIV